MNYLLFIKMFLWFAINIFVFYLETSSSCNSSEPNSPNVYSKVNNFIQEKNFESSNNDKSWYLTNSNARNKGKNI
jgi:hypothetical protein